MVHMYKFGPEPSKNLKKIQVTAIFAIFSTHFRIKGSKILNYSLEHDIPYHGLISEIVFKSRLKRHLLAIQSQSRTGDSGWLPCNHDIFSDVAI